MSELESLIEAYGRGEATFEDLDRAVDAELARGPERAAAVAEALGAAGPDALPQPVYTALAAKIDGGTGESMTRRSARPGGGAAMSAAEAAASTSWDNDEPDPRAPREEEAPGASPPREPPGSFDTGFLLREQREAVDAPRDTDPSARAAVTATSGFDTFVPGESAELCEGDRLRNRFELIAKLGAGGMGAVWKGKDLLKEEAKDRNPYVAIKLLQEDFKEHPDAFIALQRETAKQQRLAHPNVATVFNFDRDTDTGAVFMTMDMLEGESLDTFIKNIPEGGLAEAEAMPIIEQIAAGLGYAHANDLVHSDLKPGNCFLTKDGTVKLLDFGIARASKTMADAEGVTTLFDPGELGAITPAYATIEMFEGEEPDPRDDIYALGIIAYQLLTGRHPYDKLSAPKARERGLVPAPVPKLGKRQNRGLARALALSRDDRTASVDELLDDIRRKNDLQPYGIAAAIAASAIIAALAYFQITDFLRREENEAIIAVLERGGVENIAGGLAQIQDLNSERQRRAILKDDRTKDAVIDHIARGDRHRIREGLALIRPFDAKWQRDVLDHEDARDAIMEHYKGRIEDAFYPEEGRYDHAAARAHLESLAEIYPDSATVQQRANDLESERQEALAERRARFDALLEQRRLLASPGSESIGDVLEDIRRLDPQDERLKDRSLASAAIRVAGEAMEAGELERARRLLETASRFSLEDTRLTRLRHRLEKTLEEQERTRRIVELRARLESQRDALHDLGDFRDVRDDLVALASLSPDDPMLRDLRWQLEQIFATEFAAAIDAERWRDAEALLLAFARFFDIPYLTEKRRLLADAQAAKGYPTDDEEARRTALEERATTVNRLLKAPTLTPAWEAEFESAYKEFIALARPDTPGASRVRDAMALLYRDRALGAIQARRYARARNLIAKGREYHPRSPDLDAAERELVAAQQGVLLPPANEQRRDVQVAETKRRFLEQARAGDAEEARRSLESLYATLPRDDPFLTDTAPAAIAGAYLAAARARAAAGEPKEAMALLERGRQVAPEAESLREALDSYRREHDRGIRRAALEAALSKESPLEIGPLSEGLAAFAERYPKATPQLRETLAARAAHRLDRLIATMPLDGARLANELAAIDAILPGRAPRLRKTLADAVVERAQALVDEEPLAAREYVAAAMAAFASEERLARLARSLPPREIAKTEQALESGRLSAARASLARARERHPRHPRLAPLESAIEARANEARAAYEAYRRGVEERTLSDASKREAALDRVLALWADNPEFQPVEFVERRPGECEARLAGRGRSSAGVCYDLVADDTKGTLMVVVPPGPGVSRPFAIGKYEVSVEQYNRYCVASGQCRPIRDHDDSLPVTGVSRATAESFARWLSRRASAVTGEPVVYRLPTAAEWRHASEADGKGVRRGINCRPAGKLSLATSLLTARNGTVSLGLPLGRSLLSVDFGEENGWGIVNAVGNAQEWVTTPDGLAAQGGAYTDRAVECNVSLSRPHDGAPDERTGFRLVRELD